MSEASVRPLRIVLVTGLSGAGKTYALKTLEDLGYFAIDNLPSSLIEPLIMLLESNAEVSRAALAMDARDPTFIRSGTELVAKLRERGHHVTLLFLDAKTEVLVRRFAETRRPHPLDRSVPVEQAVEREVNLLAPLRGMANVVLDTSAYTIHNLRQRLHELLSQEAGPRLTAIIQSFGFKNGIPLDASYVFDVRFLRNPFFNEGLRNKTGLDPEVADFVFEDDNARPLVGSIVSLAAQVLPLCQKEGRSTVALAIGCTGGHHRSVVLAEAVALALADLPYDVRTVHRDIRQSG